MADLNLVNGYVTEGQREFMSSNSSNMDELQLAALLGKTLLEQNSELDNKLRRLQEFAEETLVLNQSLTRQLTESRDSLQFSNKTCEQLETKVDELERTNARLQRQTASQQSSLDHKTEQIQSLEDELSEARAQNERLRDQISRLASKNETMSTEDSRTRERSKSCHGNLVVSTETDKLLSELTGRVQKLTFQKEKAERDLAGVVAENESLAKNLERAEVEIEELTGRVTAFEESLERSTPLSTPRLPSTTTPTSHTDFTMPSIPEDHTPAMPPSAEKGVSLFNELDSEFSSLRHHYDTLVQGCTCSASLHHKSWSERDEGVAVGGDKEGKEIERPFKELFEEMFATLKQTAQVADRLIEKRTAQAREE